MPQCGATVLRLTDDRRGAAAQCRRWRAAFRASTGQRRPERKKLSDIKTLREDAAVADQADDIKARYLKLFKV